MKYLEFDGDRLQNEIYHIKVKGEGNEKLLNVGTSNNWYKIHHYCTKDADLFLWNGIDVGKERNERI